MAIKIFIKHLLCSYCKSQLCDHCYLTVLVCCLCFSHSHGTFFLNDLYFKSKGISGNYFVLEFCIVDRCKICDLSFIFRFTQNCNCTCLRKRFNDQNSQDVVGAAGMHAFGFLADDQNNGESTITMKLANTSNANDVKTTIVVKATVQNGTFTDVSVQE